MRQFIIFLALAFGIWTGAAQTPETRPPDYIKTVQIKSDTTFSGVPIIKLGQGLKLEFDDLVGDESDYYYKISYYDFDWEPSDLSQNEYMDGFDDMRIKDFKNSFNTLQVYTHYSLKIPNADTRKLKVSGNYMLGIYNDADELVFSKKFIVYEDLANVQTEIKRSRALKDIDTKQVVNFSIEPKGDLRLKNPDKNVKALVLKNHNLRHSITDLKPQYHMGEKLVYRYDREAAFDGGNEFLDFDNKDVRGGSSHIKDFELKDIYNTYLFTDQVRANEQYEYNPDINGNFVVRTLQGDDPDIEAEYTWVHFALDSQPFTNDGQLYVYGGFNNYALEESNLMAYNSDKDRYEAKILFKQGFYDYTYVLKRGDGPIDEGVVSGNFDKTENQYTVLAYYRDVGGRYDRVIGVGEANSKNITD